MKFELYQDGELLTKHSWNFDFLACSINHKATVNNFLEKIDTEPVDERKMIVARTSERVTRVTWTDGERGDAQYSMVANFISD